MSSTKFIKAYRNNDIPDSLIALIVKRQEEQGNTGDIDFFLRNSNIDKKAGGFNWSNTKEGGTFWATIFSGNFEPFYNLSNRGYKSFRKGDFVVVTKFKNNTVWENHWFKPGEVLKLGGIHWTKDGLKNNFHALSVKYPEGSGMRYSFGNGAYELRHATSEEILNSQFGKKEFKKGDYIVINECKESAGFKGNFVYKQREDFEYLRVVLDINGSENGYPVYSFINTTNWRYASKDEIKAYEWLGKPVSVKEINNNNNNNNKNGRQQENDVKIHRQNNSDFRGSTTRRQPVQSRAKRASITKRSFRIETRIGKREKTVRFAFKSR